MTLYVWKTPSLDVVKTTQSHPHSFKNETCLKPGFTITSDPPSPPERLRRGKPQCVTFDTSRDSCIFMQITLDKVRRDAYYLHYGAIMQINTSDKNKQGCCDDLSDSFSPGFFKALADPNRVALLVFLAESGKEQTVSDMSCCCPIDISVVSRHLGRASGRRHSGSTEARPGSLLPRPRRQAHYLAPQSG